MDMLFKNSSTHGSVGLFKFDVTNDSINDWNEILVIISHISLGIDWLLNLACLVFIAQHYLFMWFLLTLSLEKAPSPRTEAILGYVLSFQQRTKQIQLNAKIDDDFV